MSETPKEPGTADLTDAQLAAELDAGWAFGFERDPADPRFVVFTCRHPYPITVPVPPAAAGPEAQLQMVAIAVTTCAQQGIIPGQIAIRMLRDLAAQIHAVRVNGGKFPEPSRIVIPGRE